MGFPKRYDGELRETLFRRQGSQVSMRMAMIPGTGEPCGLPSMGSHRVGHVPFSSCPQSLPASESFPMSHLFA